MIQIARTRPCHVIYPLSIKEEGYTGELRGYYVENSNIYNILPLGAPLDESRCRTIGYVLPSNPFPFMESGIASRVIYFNSCDHFDAAGALGKMRAKIEEAGKKGVSETIDSREAAQKYGESIAKELTRLTPKEQEKMQQWILTVLFGCTALPEGHENDMVAFWETDSLRFIQLKSLREIEQENYSLTLDVFSRNTGILESDVMLKRGAVLIGCGSVGSFVALELAKAGVGRFMLIDNDILGYHNICRHQCGIYDVGRYKTDSLRDRILMVNPYAQVVTHRTTIQDVPLDDLFSFCDKETLAIGGADNREGDLYANDIAMQVGMPFMSIGCWERAFAGEIFYCLPSGMPNYRDFMEVSGHMSARVSQNRRFYTTETELKKVTFEPGISADIDFVSIIAVKLALDLLNRDNEHYTQRLMPHLTQYTLVCNTNSTKVGGEMAEIFSYPLQVTTSIVVPYAKKR